MWEIISSMVFNRKDLGDAEHALLTEFNYTQW